MTVKTRKSFHSSLLSDGFYCSIYYQFFTPVPVPCWNALQKTKIKKNEHKKKMEDKKKTRGKNLWIFFFVSADCPLSPSFSPLYVRVVQ